MQEKMWLACFINGKLLSGQKSPSETSTVVTGAIGKCVTLIVAFCYSGSFSTLAGRHFY